MDVECRWKLALEILYYNQISQLFLLAGHGVFWHHGICCLRMD